MGSRVMTEPEWSALVQSGQQARHQAQEILHQPVAAWERGTLQEQWRAWAVAVLGGGDASRACAAGEESEGT
jgi:hypothetical protein